MSAPQRQRLLPFVFVFSMGSIGVLFFATTKPQTVHAMVSVVILGIVAMVLAYMEDVTSDEEDDQP